MSTGAQARKTAEPGILGSATGADDHGGGQEDSEPSGGEGLGDTEFRVWARCRWGVWTPAAARGRGQGHWSLTHLFARVTSVSLSCLICAVGAACLPEGCRGGRAGHTCSSVNSRRIYVACAVSAPLLLARPPPVLQGLGCRLHARGQSWSRCCRLLDEGWPGAWART